MFLYVLAGAYLLGRLFVPRFLASSGVTTSYADGAQVVSEASSVVLISPDGGELQSTKKSAVVVGSATRAQKGDLVYEDEDLRTRTRATAASATRPPRRPRGSPPTA